MTDISAGNGPTLIVVCANSSTPTITPASATRATVAPTRRGRAQRCRSSRRTVRERVDRAAVSMPVAGHRQVAPAPPSEKTSRISRSSSGAGSPPSSWLEVLTQSEPSGARDQRAQPAVLAVQQRLGLAEHGAVAGGVDQPEALAEQAGGGDRAFRHGHAGAGRVVDRPAHQRVGVLRSPARALDLGPAVVLALARSGSARRRSSGRLARVHPLGRVPGDALHVAVPDDQTSESGPGCRAPACRPWSSAGSCRPGSSGSAPGCRSPCRRRCRRRGSRPGRTRARRRCGRRARDAGEDRLRLAAQLELGDPVVLWRSSSRCRPSCRSRTSGRRRCRAGRRRRPACTSASRCTSVTVSPSASDSGPTCRIRAVSRSVTSAPPSGRNAMPHGTSSPLASTVVDDLLVALGRSLPARPTPTGGGRLGGAPCCVGIGRAEAARRGQRQHGGRAARHRAARRERTITRPPRRRRTQGSGGCLEARVVTGRLDLLLAGRDHARAGCPVVTPVRRMTLPLSSSAEIRPLRSGRQLGDPRPRDRGRCRTAPGPAARRGRRRCRPAMPRRQPSSGISRIGASAQLVAGERDRADERDQRRRPAGRRTGGCAAGASSSHRTSSIYADGRGGVRRGDRSP